MQDSQNLALAGMPLPGTLDLWATGMNASWEPDFWGRYRRTIESSNGRIGASVEDMGVTLVMLLSEVANSYIQLRTVRGPARLRPEKRRTANGHGPHRQ